MDRNIFAERVRSVQPQLYRIACGQLRSPHDREDAVQEAICKAWRRRAALRNEEYFETWLIRILINECHNLQRANKKCSPQESFLDQAYMPDEHSDLREAIYNLDESLRLPVILHYIVGYDTKEAARILHIPHGTLCGRLKRARQKLKDFLVDTE